jgi:hypothetical protein
MMAGVNTLFVGYELNGSGDYSAVREKLAGASKWWHHLESTWLVVTEQGCDEYYNELVSCLSPEDKLLVIDVTKVTTRWCGFDTVASKWIEDSP